MSAVAASQVSKTSLAGRSASFFFAREVPYGMALVRIALPLVLLVDVVRRWPFARELYSTDGAIAQLATNFGYPGLLPEFSAPIAVGLFTILAFTLVTSSVGWCTRFSLWTATVLYFYFTNLDVLSTISKYTVIANHLLLLLGLSRCGDIWSADAWWRRRRELADDPAAPSPDLRSPVWPQRLAQILFGMIYLGAAITKMHTPAFLSGDQLVYWMMTYVNNEHPLGDYLSQFPLFVSISCFVTVVWEVAFIFTVFHRKLRWWVLAVGTVFHLLTVFTLGLIVFPIVIMASYLVFLDEADVRAILNWRLIRRLGRRLAIAQESADGSGSMRQPATLSRRQFGSIGAFALTVALVSLLGIEAEYLSDHYKMRGPDGPLPLRELTDAEVDQLLFKLDTPMRQRDKLLAFDLGTLLVGEYLASRKSEFRQGEQLVAQVTLSPPHEDMWIDCVMCEAATDKTDDDGRLVPGTLLYKTGQVVLRETFRSNFIFRLDESIEPGDYFLRLRSGNEEVARKQFKVLPASRAAAAN